MLLSAISKWLCRYHFLTINCHNWSTHCSLVNFCSNYVALLVISQQVKKLKKKNTTENVPIHTETTTMGSFVYFNNKVRKNKYVTCNVPASKLQTYPRRKRWRRPLTNLLPQMLQVCDLSNEDEDQAPPTTHFARRKSFVDALTTTTAAESGHHQTWQNRLSWIHSLGHEDLFRHKCQLLLWLLLTASNTTTTLRQFVNCHFVNRQLINLVQMVTICKPIIL